MHNTDQSNPKMIKNEMVWKMIEIFLMYGGGSDFEERLVSNNEQLLEWLTLLQDNKNVDSISICVVCFKISIEKMWTTSSWLILKIQENNKLISNFKEIQQS